ncbi:ribosomal protein S18-alanine N-acetyltransferase [Argonema antarcticum]|uniref:ribosomal protein S18-alanine N-acetyltransferase n=1 Tax=Argonema antarcticum TaxID=2942763 RepID=UPI003084589F|nr:ribosomal protein S18-alanine N-acetyltransferase [Argonema antarcticum A004/B2]
MNFLNLKPLTPELLPAVVKLDRECFGGLWTLESYQRELDSPNSDILILLKEENDEESLSPDPCHTPILGLGCLWAILDEAHITILAVHPHHRAQGLGMALLTALLSQAWQRGLERATLEVSASNETALSLYQKFGFRIAGRRRGYYQDTGEDALILWLSGLGHPEFDKTLADWDRQVRTRLASSGWNLYSTKLNMKK